MPGALAGQRVLLTRSADAGESLQNRLQQAGAQVLCRPTVALIPLDTPLPALAAAPDWLVFVSPFAAAVGWPRLPVSWQAAKVAAVGPGTARALIEQGARVSVAPNRGGGADDLLAQPAFAPEPEAVVVIVCGHGGRQRLQQVLQSRRVAVVEARVYTREPAAAQLAIPEDWQSQPLDFTVVSSAAGLEYLLGMAAPSALKWVYQSRLIAVSERIVQKATAAGFVDPVIATGADDAAVLAAIFAHAGSVK